MDLAIYQDLFVNFEAFGQGFTTAFQSAIDAWAQAFDFFGANDAAAEAGAETQVNGLSSQFGLGAEAGVEAAEATESAQNGGLNLNLETGFEANL